MFKIAVIGAGPAGLIAAAYAAKDGCSVHLIDKNEKTGKKLFLTGKGRCNITNAADKIDFMKKIVRNPKFMYSAFDSFFNTDIMEIIRAQGVQLKTERGGRIFPESDKSSDVIRALTGFALKQGVELRLNTRVVSIEKKETKFEIVFEKSVGNRISEAYNSVIIATGGASYTSTGSTGDGYAFAKTFGHTVVEPKPALIPLETEEDWPRELMGLSLKNVKLKAFAAQSGWKIGKKPIFEDIGEMVFTHFGVSGPLILSASSYIADSPKGALLEIDLKPALDLQTLDSRLLRDFEKYKHKHMKNAMVDLLPGRLISTVLRLADIEEEQNVDVLTRTQRLKIANTMKCLRLTVRRANSIDEAIITRGGVSVKEINSSTMESKLVEGLYFAGEIIDVDACTGGYNLQIAYSTGALAGMSSCRCCGVGSL